MKEQHGPMKTTTSMIIPREQPLRWRIEAVEGVMGQTVTLPADAYMPRCLAAMDIRQNIRQSIVCLIMTHHYFVEFSRGLS